MSPFKRVQPSEDTFDDVEGHGVTSKHVDGGETDDVEGHGIKHVDGPETDDVEGHVVRGRGVVEDQDDVEGHGSRRG
jgi:hypothetical protein